MIAFFIFLLVAIIVGTAIVRGAPRSTRRRGRRGGDDSWGYPTAPYLPHTDGGSDNSHHSHHHSHCHHSGHHHDSGSSHGGHDAGGGGDSGGSSGGDSGGGGGSD